MIKEDLYLLRKGVFTMTDLIISATLLVLVFFAVRAWRRQGCGGCSGCPHAAKCSSLHKEDQE
jgi:hypothetical protein